MEILDWILQGSRWLLLSTAGKEKPDNHHQQATSRSAYLLKVVWDRLHIDDLSKKALKKRSVPAPRLPFQRRSYLFTRNTMLAWPASCPQCRSRNRIVPAQDSSSNAAAKFGRFIWQNGSILPQTELTQPQRIILNKLKILPQKRILKIRKG